MKKLLTLLLILMSFAFVFAQKPGELKKKAKSMRQARAKTTLHAQYEKKAATIFTEGFESGVVPPAGWTAVVNNPYTWEYDSYSPYSGSYNATCLYDESYTGNQDEWLVTPAIDLGGYADAALNFAWNGSYYWSVDPYDNCDLTVQITTNGGTNWTALWDESKAGVFTNWTWYTVNLDLTSYCNQEIKIAFVYSGYDGAQFCVDEVVLEGTLAPITVTPAEFNVVLGPDQTSTQTLTISNGTIDPLPYKIEVAEVADKSGAALNEGFENVTFPPTGWTSTSVLGAKVWTRSIVNYNTGVASAYMAYESTGGEDWLITPQQTIVNGDKLDFYLRKGFTTAYPPDFLDVRISTTTTATASFTSSLSLIDVANSVAGWNHHTLDLSAYAGQNIYIAFKHTDDDGDGCYLDDVSIISAPPPPAGIDWLTVTPTAGTVTAGSAANISVEFDTEGLDVGATYQAEITLTADSPAKEVYIIPVTLTVGFSLSGNLLYYGCNNPIPNHEVILKGAAEAEYTATTDANGAFEFPGLVEGVYNLSIPSEGEVLPVGAMNWADYQLLQYVVRYPRALLLKLTGLQLWAADLDGNGLINNADVNWMFRRLNHSVNFFPIDDWYFNNYTIDIDGESINDFVAVGISAGDINSSYPWTNTLKESLLSEEIPTTYNIEQNYPNPFNPTTVINYQIPQNNMVEISVYNTLGEKVTTLVNEMKEAGFYTLQFDASNLSSGIYFYRITAGDFIQTMKMMLVR